LTQLETGKYGWERQVRRERSRERRGPSDSVLRRKARRKARGSRRFQESTGEGARRRPSHSKRTASDRGHRLRDEHEGTSSAQRSDPGGDRRTWNPHRPYAGLAFIARRYGRILAATQGAS